MKKLSGELFYYKLVRFARNWPPARRPYAPEGMMEQLFHFRGKFESPKKPLYSQWVVEIPRRLIRLVTGGTVSSLRDISRVAADEINTRKIQFTRRAGRRRFWHRAEMQWGYLKLFNFQ